MAKLTIPTIASGYASTDTLNNAFDLIEAAVENTLSRDGTVPNNMTADLDMNGKRILNLPAPATALDVVRLQDVAGTGAKAISMWKGDWDSGTTYVLNEAVKSIGSAWISLQNGNLNKNPATEPTWWSKMVDKGDIGPGGGDLLAANNLSDLTNATTARTNLGLAIGTNVQAQDATLQSLAGLGTAADKFPYTTGIDTWAEATITAQGRALLDDATAANQRTTLGLVIGTDVQAQDATLQAIASLGTVADRTLYTTGVDTWAETPLTAAGRALLDDASAAAQRTTLGLVIGTDVQAQDATLAALATYNTNGLLTQTAPDVFVGRSIAAGAGVSVSNADGVSGNPTITLTDVGLPAPASFGAGDKLIIFEGNVPKVIDYTSLPGATGGLNNIVEDLTPQLGGDLDANNFNVGFDNNTGITDDVGNETLIFKKVASAVNFAEITNSATGSPPLLKAAGVDTNVDLQIEGKGTGGVIGTFKNTGLHVLDTDASHDLIIAAGSNVTADRTLSLITGDADRTLDISASSVTISSAGAALLDDANSSAQRTTLGLVIGTDVQAYDAGLTSLAALATGADKMPYTTGVDTYAETALTAAGRALLDDASASAQRTTLGLVIGTDVQAYDPQLDSLSGLSYAANALKVVRVNAGETGFELATPAGGGDMLAANNLSDLANAATARTNLGVAIGTNVQAYDAGLTSLAALATAGDKMPYTTSADTYAETALTATARSLLDDTSTAAMLSTLGARPLVPRVSTEASNAAPAINADSYDIHTITALATAPTFGAPTGTPYEGQKIIYRIKDNATARALAWNAIYRAVGVALPTTTVVSKTLYVGFIYNSTDSKWDCIASAQEA